MTEKVAIFLDVENLSGWLKADGGESLLERASELGRVVVRRAYGNFSIPSVSVRQPELNLLGFEFVHVYHPVKGKNSADIQIVVDVMEYLARIPDLEWVILATGDSDFSPLFRRLRELGKSVVGVGPRSALSEAVKKSCNRFIYIDEESTANGASTPLKASQLREDALDLLERVLNKFPDGANLSVLKNKMLEFDSAFDEKNLGFSGFKKFLQSVPEIVDLYQVKQTWHAKSQEPEESSSKNSESASSQQNTVIKPTIDIYQRLLRKSSWRSCEASFLCDALGKLRERFPQGFTRSEEFKYMVEEFGHNRTRSELRAAIYLLYKSGYVDQQSSEESEEHMFTAASPGSEREMSEKIDAILISRLDHLCRANNVSFIPKVVMKLLLNSYSKDQFRILLDSATE
ncbi:MAG: NYN domain-containing protein [Cyanobacteria bacterium P01_B01_bin.77]